MDSATRLYDSILGSTWHDQHQHRQKQEQEYDIQRSKEFALMLGVVILHVDRGINDEHQWLHLDQRLKTDVCIRLDGYRQGVIVDRTD